MSNDRKWIGWDEPETIISNFAKELKLHPKATKLLKPGAFTFDDGTTQGWKIDQLYDSNDPTMTKIDPFKDPKTNKFYGFCLCNSQNLALAIEASPLIVSGSNAKSFDFYIESPDLLNNQDWKSIKGYRLDLQRNYYGPIGGDYKVQLQIKVRRKSTNKFTYFAEFDSKTGDYVFHPIVALKPYNFTWTADVFSDPDLELRFLRIRFTQPNFSVPGLGEAMPKGPWLVGNIGPE